MALRIREADLTDLALLNKLGFGIYRAHFQHMWISEAELNDFLDAEYGYPTLEQSLQDPGTSWYLAEASTPVGFAKITWESVIPQTSVSGALLNKLYLHPTATGKHYGKLMFEECVMRAQKRGKKYLWLEVLDQNERAYRFYETQGMQHIKDIAFKTPSQQSMLKIMGMAI